MSEEIFTVHYQKAKYHESADLLSYVVSLSILLKLLGYLRSAVEAYIFNNYSQL